MSIAEQYAIKPYGRTVKGMGRLPGSGKPPEPAKPPTAFGPQRKQHDGHYDLGGILSHNCLWYLVAGARGIGKTFDWKRKGINRWIKRREQFIYLRRFEEELKSIGQFFADIQHLYPEWDFRVNGRQFEVAPASTRDDKKREWDVCGFAVALSTAQNKKGVSYHNVTWLGFDEFILEKSAQHYLPNEAEILLNFYNTVDRFQEKTIMVCLANAVSIDNPYFTYLKILPDKEIIKGGGGFWLAHFPQSEEFKASIATTRFGQFIEGTAYYDYSVQNQFSDNHKHLVGLKNEKALHYFNLELKSGVMAIWQDVVGGKWYATAKPVNGQLTLTLLPEKHTEEKTLVFPNSDVILNLMAAFQTHRLYFDSPATRNTFLDLFNGKR
jgi:hypothetical protein